jgi:uncharacterized protein (TIGR02145 family)
MRIIFVMFFLLFNVYLKCQVILDYDGNEIKYYKIGHLFWTENIKTTTQWNNQNKLLKVTSAPMPEKDHTGSLIISQNDINRFNGRHYLENEGRFYYTWNTANNLTAQKNYVSTKYSQIDGTNTDNSNSSICPCGWRIPSFEEISDLLVSTKVFANENEFKKWLFEDGLFNSKFLFNQGSAVATKDDIDKIKLLGTFINEKEMGGMYGFMQGDANKPMGKDLMFSVWLRNMGPSWSIDMQMDGAFMLISAPKLKPDKIQLVVGSDFSTAMASVKCVTDDEGMKKYNEWVKKIKAQINNSEQIVQSIYDLIEEDKYIEGYKIFESEFNEKRINDNFATKIYNSWNVSFISFVDNLLSSQNTIEAKKLVEFYEQKALSINKDSEKTQIAKWQEEIKINRHKIKINELKGKPLSDIEKLFIGKWKFKSNSIYFKDGEIYNMEEIWIVNQDRTYHYESRFQKFLEKSYLNEYIEDGVFEIEQNSFGDLIVVAYILVEQGKSSSRIDKMKFDQITAKKASRTITFEDAKYPAKLKGKKN